MLFTFLIFICLPYFELFKNFRVFFISNSFISTFQMTCLKIMRLKSLLYLFELSIKSKYDKQIEITEVVNLLFAYSTCLWTLWKIYIITNMYFIVLRYMKCFGSFCFYPSPYTYYSFWCNRLRIFVLWTMLLSGLKKTYVSCELVLCVIKLFIFFLHSDVRFV